MKFSVLLNNNFKQYCTIDIITFELFENKKYIHSVLISVYQLEIAYCVLKI